MLIHHSDHVYSLSSSPHRKAAEAATSTSRATVGYERHEWSLLSISRPLVNTTTGTTRSILTVTLLYRPARTLYAWPFDLSGTNSRGTCYVTPFVKDANAEPIQPHEEALKTSLKVLADVVRRWIIQRQSYSPTYSPSDSSRWGNPGLDRNNGSPDPLQAEFMYGRRASDIGHADTTVEEINSYLGLDSVSGAERLTLLSRQMLPYVNPNTTAAWAERSAEQQATNAVRPGPSVRRTGDQIRPTNGSSTSFASSGDSDEASESSAASTPCSSPEISRFPDVKPCEPNRTIAPRSKGRLASRAASLPNIDVRAATAINPLRGFQPINDADFDDGVTPTVSATSCFSDSPGSSTYVADTPSSPACVPCLDASGLPQIVVIEPTPPSSSSRPGARHKVGSPGSAEEKGSGRPSLVRATSTLDSVQEDEDVYQEPNEHRTPTLDQDQERPAKTFQAAEAIAEKLSMSNDESRQDTATDPGLNSSRSKSTDGVFAALARPSTAAAVALANAKAVVTLSSAAQPSRSRSVEDEQLSRSTTSLPRAFAARIPQLLRKSSRELRKLSLSAGSAK